MKLVLSVYSSHADYDADCRCAVVDVTEELLTTLRRRFDLASQVRQADQGLWVMYFWSHHPAFYGYSLIQACGELAAGSSSDWEAEFDSRGMTILPEGVRLEDFSSLTTECDQEIVRHRVGGDGNGFEIAWTASPKHSDIYLTTEAIRLEQLEVLAQGVISWQRDPKQQSRPDGRVEEPL